jgi:hypothetical protein
METEKSRRYSSARISERKIDRYREKYHERKGGGAEH